MLAKGNSRVHYADQVVEVEKQVLCFSNPQIPYRWEHLDEISKENIVSSIPSFLASLGN